MATKIVTKNSSTASAVPTASDLVQGELAVNVADKRLFTEDNAGAIVELGTNPSTIDINAGSIDGTAIGASSASTGAFTTLTATGAFTSRGIDDNADATAITIDSSENVGIGTSSPQSIVHIDQGASGDAQLTLETHAAGDSKIVFSQGQTAGNWAVGYDDGGGVTENSLSFAYKADGYPSLSGQNKMILTPAGNVGIGISTPTLSAAWNTVLHVKSAALGAELRLADSDSGGVGDVGLVVGQYGGNSYIMNQDSGGTFFWTGGGEKMRIDSSGNVGIGQAPSTFSNWKILELKGGTAGAMLNFENSSSTRVSTLAYDDAVDSLRIQNFLANPITFETSNTERMRIDANGKIFMNEGVPFAWTDGSLNVSADIYGDSSDNLVFRNTSAKTERMRIDSSGNVGIGISSPSTRLEVGGGGGSETIKVSAGAGWADVRLHSDATNGGSIYFNDGADAGQLFYYHVDDSMRFHTATAERMRISSSGNVGIGTSSPSTKLHLGGTAPLDSIIRQDSTVSGTNWEIGEREAGKWQIFEDDSDSVVATFMSSGNVGIGETDPDSTLTVKGSAHTNFQVKSNSESTKAFIQTVQDSDVRIGSSTNHPVSFYQNGTERMRIDASGNLLVGTTTTAAGNEGMVYFNGSSLRVTRDSDEPLNLDRLTSDGAIAVFKKDGTTVGSIGTQGGDLYLGTDDANIKFFNSASIQPVNSVGGVRDNAIDIGASSARFKDLYLSGNIVASGEHSLLNDNNEANFFNNLTSSSQIYFGYDDIPTGANIQSYGFYGGTGTTTFVPLLASAFTVSSDYRLKENVVSLSNGIDRLKQLSPKQFTWVENNPMGVEPNQVVDGFLAHEVQDVIPEAVHGEKDAEISDKGEGYQRIDQAKIVPLLTAALQEAITKIENLQSRVTELENN